MELARRIWNAFQNVRHRGMIQRSGLFQVEAYQQHYLQDSRFNSRPLLHYLLIGEWNGCRPNAFFDPMWFDATAGTKQLWKYLTNRDFWDKQTSAMFDGRVYRHQITQESRLETAPLVDFWQHGFDADLDSSDRFSMAFFKQATTRDIWDKKAFAFAVFMKPDGFILSADDLKKRQEAFYRSIEMKIIKEQNPPTTRHNLVFIQSGSDFCTKFLENRRTFDVLLNYYEPVSEIGADCEIAIYQKGTKVTAIRKILDARPELFLRYDKVLFLDDDVTITSETIERFFEAMEREGLDLAQPSLTPDSTTFFPDLKQPQVGQAVRKLTAVEIMMPGLSQRALAKCGWVFSTGISGWAVDFLLGAEIQKAFSTHPAVIGACVAEHLRPFDTENGRFYRFLLSHGIDARVEAGAIALRYGIDDSTSAITFVE